MTLPFAKAIGTYVDDGKVYAVYRSTGGGYSHEATGLEAGDVDEEP